MGWGGLGGCVLLSSACHIAGKAVNVFLGSDQGGKQPCLVTHGGDEVCRLCFPPLAGEVWNPCFIHRVLSPALPDALLSQLSCIKRYVQRTRVPSSHNSSAEGGPPADKRLCPAPLFTLSCGFTLKKKKTKQ